MLIIFIRNYPIHQILTKLSTISKSETVGYQHYLKWTNLESCCFFLFFLLQITDFFLVFESNSYYFNLVLFRDNKAHSD